MSDRITIGTVRKAKRDMEKIIGEAVTTFHKQTGVELNAYVVLKTRVGPDAELEYSAHTNVDNL